MRVGKLRFIVGLIVALIFSSGAAAVAGSETGRIQPGNTFKDCPDCPEMVVIPAGNFLMGSSAADTERDFAAVLPSENGMAAAFGFTEAWMAKKSMPREHPQHPVTIPKSFSLGKYHVTNGEFAAFVRETGYSTGPCNLWTRVRALHSTGAAWPNPGFTQTDRDPVVCVSWEDAKAYIGWLNKKIRGNASQGGDGPYRLPSEAEWEYAARAGTQTARWWGDTIGAANAKCDGCGNFGDRWQTAPVGSFPANPFGLYEILGNAWQWTEDCWHETYTSAPSDGSAWTEADCTLRAFRGGGWNNSPWSVRSATRSGKEMDHGTNDLGFRVAKALR